MWPLTVPASARLCISGFEARLDPELSLLAYLEAAAPLAFVLASVARVDTAANIAALASGLVLAPALATLTGQAVGRRRSLSGRSETIEE